MFRLKMCSRNPFNRHAFPVVLSTILVSLLGNANVGAQDWINDFDQPLDFRCPEGHGVSRVMSYHDNGKEDRRWAFECKLLPADLGPITCMQTGFVNNYDEDILIDLPYWTVLSGAHSVHDSGKEDRRWDFYVCGVIGVYCPYNGFWTEEVNSFDGDMDFIVPEGYHIVGVWSHHDNSKEDRVWKFEVAQIFPCS